MMIMNLIFHLLNVFCNDKYFESKNSYYNNKKLLFAKITKDYIQNINISDYFLQLENSEKITENKKNNNFKFMIENIRKCQFTKINCELACYLIYEIESNLNQLKKNIHLLSLHHEKNIFVLLINIFSFTLLEIFKNKLDMKKYILLNYISRIEYLKLKIINFSNILFQYIKNELKLDDPQKMIYVKAKKLYLSINSIYLCYSDLLLELMKIEELKWTEMFDISLIALKNDLNSII